MSQTKAGVDTTTEEIDEVRRTASATSRSIALLPTGRIRIADRVYERADRISEDAGHLRIDKPHGVGATIRLITPRGESTADFSGDEWVLNLPEDVETSRSTTGPTPTVSIKAAAGKPQRRKEDARKAPVVPWGSHVLATWTFLKSFAATLSVLMIATLVAIFCNAGWVDQIAPHTTFEIDGEKWYAIGLHWAYHPRWEELALWAVGVLVFGFLVERNGGTARTITVMAAGSLGGLGGWWLFNTPTGLDVVNRESWRAYWILAEKVGLGEANMFAEGWTAMLPLLRWNAPIAGMAGICGALIAYAAVRRQIRSDNLTVRPIKAIAAVVYLSVLLFLAWPKLLGTPIPYAMLLGGFASGIAMIIPEKASEYLWDRFKDWYASQRRG